MANFILIHGAWHWGGCFDKLAAALTARGHQVAAPDLAGHGADTTQAAKVRDMAQYTAAARTLLEAVDGQAILLGHSMGGASCTYLAEQMPEKIAALVYLTAFMTPDAASPNDYIFSEAYLQSDAAAEFLSLLSPSATGIRLDVTKPDLLKQAFYADCDDAEIAALIPQLTLTQPLAPFISPASITAARGLACRRIYIECTQDRAIPLAIQRQMQADSPGTEVLTMETSHSPFLSHPERLAAMLDQAAQRSL